MRWGGRVEYLPDTCILVGSGSPSLQTVDAEPVFLLDEALDFWHRYDAVAVDVHVVEARSEIQILLCDRHR